MNFEKIFTLFFVFFLQVAELQTKSYKQREESRIASTYLIHCRETQLFDNILKQIKRISRENEEIEYRWEKRKINTIKRVYEKKTAAKITSNFMSHIKTELKKRKQKLHLPNDEELLQRYSKLTEENVAKCVELAFEIFINLDAPYSTLDIIHQTSQLLLRIAISVCIFL